MWKMKLPLHLWINFEAIYTGFVNGATIMGTLFISSGVIYLLEVSGAFGAGINMILKRQKAENSLSYVSSILSLSCSECSDMEKRLIRSILLR